MLLMPCILAALCHWFLEASHGVVVLPVLFSRYLFLGIVVEGGLKLSSSMMWSNHLGSRGWQKHRVSHNRSKRRLNVSWEAAWVCWNFASRWHVRMGALSLWAVFSGEGLCVGPVAWNRAGVGSQGALLPHHQTTRINKTAPLMLDEIKSSGSWPKHGQQLLWALELPIACTS